MNAKIYEELFFRYPNLTVCRSSISQVFELIKETFLSNRKLLICGNGGSAADAEHLSAELLKGFRQKRPLRMEIIQKIKNVSPHERWSNHLQQALPVIPLVNNLSLITAVSNDTAAELIFAQQVLAYGKAGDSLLAISTSGNSKNIINAVILAKALELKTIGLTGESGGELKNLCDLIIAAPASRTEHIQELHLPIYHTLCALLEDEFFSISL